MADIQMSSHSGWDVVARGTAGATGCFAAHRIVHRRPNLRSLRRLVPIRFGAKVEGTETAGLIGGLFERGGLARTVRILT